MSRHPQTLRSFAAAAILLSLTIATPTRAQGLPRDEATAVGFDPAKLAKIQTLLDDAVTSKKIAGAAALVGRNGRIAFVANAGMRDIEANAPFTEDTIVRMASMSKPITSVAVMTLVDEGKLSLDDPVSKYLPEFTNMSVIDANGKLTPAERPITVKHLITHTSGLSYRFLNDPKVGKLYIESAVSDGLSETPGTIGDNIKRLARLPLLFQPGEQFSYSLGTDVLGRLVEVVSGKTFDEYLRERIFTPLKMSDTYFVLPADKRDRLAAVYEPGADGTVHRLSAQVHQKEGLVYTASYPTWDDGHYYSGGAGLVSTIGDYARFMQMLCNQGSLDGAQIIKPETVAAMTTNQLNDVKSGLDPNADRFGLGFSVVTEASKKQTPTSIGTFGWGGFWGTLFWVDPEKKLIAVIVTQNYPGPDTPLATQFQKLTYEALND